MTKSRVFKNVNLRTKADRSLSRQFPEKPFQAPKIILKSPKLIGQKSLSYAHLLKDKRLKLTFLTEPTIQVLVRGRSSYFKTLAHPETENKSIFYGKKNYIRKFCYVKARGFWFKN